MIDDHIDPERLATLLKDRETLKRAIVLEALDRGVKWLVDLRTALGPLADSIFTSAGCPAPPTRRGWLIDSTILALETEGLVEVKWLHGYPYVCRTEEQP